MRYFKNRYLSVLAACVLASLAACSCANIFKPEAKVRQDRAQEWERVFARDTGWTGADVASSIVIPGNRVLWVFGDTWVGEVEDGRHARAVMVNNSIAVHAFDPARPEKAPSPAEVTFIWGKPDESGEPNAWIRPDKKHRSAKQKNWYWPTGGGVVFPVDEGDHALALFLILLEKKQGDDSVWGFQCTGSAVAIIDNVEDLAGEWDARIIDLPHKIKDKEVDWGVAALYQSPHVFIYGAVSNPSNTRDLVLARVGPRGFADFGQWEFWDGKKWSTTPRSASIIVKDVASELSVDEVGSGYLMVHSEPLLGDRIFLRRSNSPEGPWSDATPVYQVPDVVGKKNLFTYAAKGHAALSAPGTLLISYIVNSHDFNELANNASIYRPRFITVPLKDSGIH